MKKILETDRLFLRKFVREDDTALFEIFVDGGMPQMLQTGFLDIDSVRSFLNRMFELYAKNDFGLWAVIEKETGKLIGYCGVHEIKLNETEDKVELAYRIYKKVWGKGLATEAATAVLTYAFAVLKLPEIVCCIAHDNDRSMRVAEKVGLVYWKDGTFKSKPCRVYRTMKGLL